MKYPDKNFMKEVVKRKSNAQPFVCEASAMMLFSKNVSEIWGSRNGYGTGPQFGSEISSIGTGNSTKVCGIEPDMDDVPADPGESVRDMWHTRSEGCAAISESEETENMDGRHIPEMTSCDTTGSDMSLLSVEERRKMFSDWKRETCDGTIPKEDDRPSGRLAMRRKSMMAYSKQEPCRGSRDSVESIGVRKASVVDIQTASTEIKPRPSLRRASFAVPHFLKRDHSLPETVLYRKTSDDVSRPETEESRKEIARVLNEKTSRWKKAKLKLDVSIREVQSANTCVRVVYLSDVQSALETFLGRRDPVVILKAEDSSEILTSSCDGGLKGIQNFGHRITKSSVDESKDAETGTHTPLDNMPPQNNNSISNDVRRRSISDVIDAMKSDPRDYQSQMKACNDMGRFAADDELEVLIKKQEAISGMVTAMLTFMDRRELLQTACQALVTMSANSEASCIQICRGNGIPTLLQIARTHGDHAPLLIMVLEILGNVSLTEDLAEVIVQHAGHSEVLATLSRQRDDYRVAKLCCFILGNLVNRVEVAQSIMYVGGVHSIITALRTFPTNAEVLENGCRALGCFSAHDEICMDVVNAGAIEAVLVAMTTTQNVATLQECGCWALACLTKFEESCINFCNNKGIGTIMKTLERFRTEEALQEYGCWAISNISAHDQTLAHVTCPKVLSVVMDAMCQFPDNLEIQHQIFFAIGQIVMTSGERQKQLVKSGGIRSVVNIMTSFPDSPELQEHGCRILGNVAVNELLRKLIENDGGSKAVIAAMLTHDRHEQIQTYGCMALTNITADVAENKGNVVKNSGVSAVLAAIKEMTSDDHVVLCGMKTLCNLMGGEDASYYFMEEEGLETMDTILSLYTNNVNIQRHTCRILASVPLAPGIDDNCLSATEDMLHQTLRRYPGDPDLHLSICHYVEKLVLTESGRIRFERLGHLNRLTDAMTFLKDDKDVQMSGCKTIAAISMYKHSVQKAELCVNLVLDVMRIFHGCSSIQTVCCGAISYLAEQNESLRDYILRKGGLDVMICNIHEHPDDEGLAVVGLMALDSITHSGITDTDRMRQEIEFVSQVMRRYPDNIELQIYSCNILTAVGKDCNCWCDCPRSDIIEPVTCILRRRRSNPELESTAREALTLLLTGESDDVIREIREKLPFLEEEFWEKCYRTVLHID